METNVITRLQIEDLYLQGHSMAEIAIKLHCSEHKVAYWMSKYNVKRRSRSDALYLKLNPNGDPFKIKSLLNQEETFLFGLGLGIYWGEGEKASKNALRVANTDPYIIKTFIKFLQAVCTVEKQKFTYSIVCFNDISPKNASAYWAKMLGISEQKFGKIVQIPPQGKGIYKKKSQFGVCTVTVSNTKLKRWIIEELDKLRLPG